MRIVLTSVMQKPTHTTVSILTVKSPHHCLCTDAFDILTKSQPDHESSLLNILFCGVRFEHPRTKYHSLLGPVPFQVGKRCSKNVVTSRYLCMPQKRDTENPMKNLSYLALLLGAKNSCFSTDEKRFLLF